MSIGIFHVLLKDFCNIQRKSRCKSLGRHQSIPAQPFLTYRTASRLWTDKSRKNGNVNVTRRTKTWRAAAGAPVAGQNPCQLHQITPRQRLAGNPRGKPPVPPCGAIGDQASARPAESNRCTPSLGRPIWIVSCSCRSGAPSSLMVINSPLGSST